MRLIDADAFIERTKQYKDKYGTDEIPYNIVHEAFIYDIGEEPTVEAIPIDMLKDLIADPEISSIFKLAYSVLITANDMTVEADKLVRRITDGKQ